MYTPSNLLSRHVCAPACYTVANTICLLSVRGSCSHPYAHVYLSQHLHVDVYVCVSHFLSKTPVDTVKHVRSLVAHGNVAAILHRSFPNQPNISTPIWIKGTDGACWTHGLRQLPYTRGWPPCSFLGLLYALKMQITPETEFKVMPSKKMQPTAAPVCSDHCLHAGM